MDRRGSEEAQRERMSDDLRSRSLVALVRHVQVTMSSSFLGVFCRCIVRALDVARVEARNSGEIRRVRDRAVRALRRRI